jgi:acyl dehydratase
LEALATLRSRVGEVVHLSDWLEITQERVTKFADVTNDHQWIHVDPSRARAELTYGGTIAHGFLTLSLLPYLRGLGDSATQPFPGVKRLLNYGSNRVRYPNAVPVGAHIRGRFELLSLAEITKNEFALVERGTVEIKNSAKPACVAELLMRIYF